MLDAFLSGKQPCNNKFMGITWPGRCELMEELRPRCVFCNIALGQHTSKMLGELIREGQPVSMFQSCVARITLTRRYACSTYT